MKTVVLNPSDFFHQKLFHWSMLIGTVNLKGGSLPPGRDSLVRGSFEKSLKREMSPGWETIFWVPLSLWAAQDPGNFGRFQTLRSQHPHWFDKRWRNQHLSVT